MNFHLALVTGATSGIGFAICKYLSNKGINLLATGRDIQELKNLQKEIADRVSIQILAADLSQVEGRKQVIEWIYQKIPDLVINNAGFGLYGDALTYSTEEQVKILTVNGQALLEITLESARTLLSHQRPGVIVNVSSAAAFQTFAGSTVYAASKAFVNQFSQSLDFECRPLGVKILTICPGMVNTNFQRRATGDFSTQKGMQTGMHVMSTSFVAEEIWRQIQSAQTIRIIHWMYRILTFLSFFIPNKWVASCSRKIISARIKPRKFIKIKSFYDNY